MIHQKREVVRLPSVKRRPGESPEQLLRRFKKEVMKSKVLSDVRRKRWFISKSELRRIEKKKAIRRVHKTRTYDR
ncbi:MAG: 30S ribosomal protein S21 [Chloroflexi bacterium]|jgi:small subunit ribosomal protein S21|nr:30S ribosomal protein S21 [Chloroflexota bacterium]